MADIFGKVTEHPEFDVTDERRFTVEIKQHPYVSPGVDPVTLRRRTGCEVCGFPQKSPVHDG